MENSVILIPASGRARRRLTDRPLADVSGPVIIS